MKRLSSKDLTYLARHPTALVKFQATGRFDRPAEILQEPPLLALLRQISPRDLGLIQGVALGPGLGFHPHGRKFHHAGHLKRWLETGDWGPGALLPSNPRVTLEDLLDAATHAPDLKHFSRYRGRLARRAQRASNMDGPTL